MIKKNIFLIYFLLIHLLSFAQQGKEYFLIDSVNHETLSPDDKTILDSLLPLYKNAKDDTIKLDILGSLAESINDETMWPKYNQLLFAMSEKLLHDSKLHDKKEINTIKKYYAGALQNFGFYAIRIESDNKKALEYYEKSLAIQQEVLDKEGEGTTLNNIAMVFETQGDILKALEYELKSLKINEDLKNKNGISIMLNNIANLHLIQGDTAKALTYLKKGIALQEEIGYNFGLAYSLNSIGLVYFQQKNYPEAIVYYKKGIKISEKVGDKNGLASTLVNLGRTYQKLEQENNNGFISKDSLSIYTIGYMLRGLKLFEETNNKQGISRTSASIGLIYYSENNISQALDYGKRALKVAQEIGYPDETRSASELLFKVYRKQGKWQNALAMHELYMQMRDSVFNQETQKSTFKQQTKYEYEKQQVLKDAEHQKELAVAEEEKKRQRIVSYSIGLGLLLVAVFSVIIFNRLRVTRKQKIIIEQKNKNITDSINYAKRIQDSILPSHDELSKQFSDYFIFFRPKDIVSGDFYWLSSHDGKFIFAVADCTGHGVPGAFMSMIGNTLLNEIVNEKFIFQPAEILNQLNEGVIHALHQESRSQDDGMEISICLFELDKKKITFAGAGHSLIIVKNKIIEVIKGDAFSIGSLFGPSSSLRNEKNFSFSQKEISLSENQMLYFSTDGFADQRGGAGGKRFFTKQLEELLLNVSSLPIKTQEEKITKAFESWKGNYAQQDDVLLAGIKI
ncbi:MAG: tetratricopeptide repeat protein [Bacteroidetes bacterium]|nr:tetratricopeptide repeat protein [Bacteroidota bacterium]